MHRTLPNPDTHPPITPEHTGSQHLPRKSVAVADWRALRSVWLTQLEAKALAVETPSITELKQRGFGAFNLLNPLRRRFVRLVYISSSGRCRVPTEQTHQGLLHLDLIRLIHASRARTKFACGSIGGLGLHEIPNSKDREIVVE